MILVQKVKLALIALATIALLQDATVNAQDRAPIKTISNTAWVGGETVTGRPTKLGFAFRADGSCGMVDDVSPGVVNGTYQQDGDQVTIRFGNCIYRGRIMGNRIVGTAQPTGGDGGSWSFEVQFAPAPAPR
ncbi:MAG: hypothetical protein U0793_12835 [Gemmataceae bacterium]